MESVGILPVESVGVLPEESVTVSVAASESVGAFVTELVESPELSAEFVGTVVLPVVSVGVPELFAESVEACELSEESVPVSAEGVDAVPSVVSLAGVSEEIAPASVEGVFKTLPERSAEPESAFPVLPVPEADVPAGSTIWEPSRYSHCWMRGSSRSYRIRSSLPQHSYRKEPS